MMDANTLQKLATDFQIYYVDLNQLRMFIELLTEQKQHEIDALQSELYIAKAQNELYKSIVNESF